MRHIRKPISARYTSHISLITAEPSLEGSNPLLKKTDCFCCNRPKHKGDSKNTHISVSNFGSWLEFSVLSLPVSFCQGLTSLRHCPLPRAVPCTIHQKKKIKNHSPLDSLSCFCFTDTYPMGCAHLETIDLSAELARSHGFFAPSRRQNDQFHL